MSPVPRTIGEPLVALRGIWKRFGTVVANAGIDLDLRPGEVHALLGENGAGKTTLMKVLYGLYQPDAGSILVEGYPVRFRSPADALRAGIAMVTQHFALVPVFTAAQNIVLGAEPSFHLRSRDVEARISAIAEQASLTIDPRARVENLSVGEQQRVEILKALYRECRVLILDEPTAVLTPQETKALFQTLRTLVESGLSVVLISHKLEEVLAVADWITVLRAGQVVARLHPQDTNPAELARLMVGRDVALPRAEDQSQATEPVLELDQITVRDANGVTKLDEVSLVVHAGEILGLAGVAGNGQRELLAVTSGVLRPTSGRLRLFGTDITELEPRERTRLGLGRVPEDRFEALVGDLSLAENVLLEDPAPYVRRLGQLDRRRMRITAQKLISEFDIRGRPETPIRALSGGNQQKVVLARVLARSPRALVVAQPTRGLDVSATAFVRQQILEQRARGVGILLITEDLDELLALADRIAVIVRGRIVGVMNRQELDLERLGLLMAGTQTVGQA